MKQLCFFFVLSGFLIHHNYARKLSIGIRVKSIDYSSFYWRRMVRIFPPFLISLLITYLLDQFGYYLGFSIYTNSTPYPSVNLAVTHFLDLKTLVGNLFLILEPTVKNFGSNSVTWSLKFEWWFYMLYPLFFLLVVRSSWLAYGAVILLWLLSFVPEIWPLKMMQQISTLFICWWFGVFLADVRAGRIQISSKGIFLGLLSLFVAPFIQNAIVYDFMISAFFVGLVAFLFTLSEENWLIKAINRFNGIGKFSYTLYIIHFPILVFMSGWLIHTSGFLPIHSGFILIGLALVLVLSYVVSLIVEKPFFRK
ncbi:MAG: acyltransferase [Flammeovirgaceae bacterium]|nr:acyltransferase [Flammeovirgaceae bacterium]